MTRFWERKTLDELTPEEWEKLCDGCGRCCLNKFQDIDTEQVLETDVACRLLDCATGRCSNYSKRFELVPDCMSLTPEAVKTVNWLPPTCAYRLRNEGKPLPDWHPLNSGTYETVKRAGVSVAGKCVSEDDVENLEEHITNWLNSGAPV